MNAPQPPPPTAQTEHYSNQRRFYSRWLWLTFLRRPQRHTHTEVALSLSSPQVLHRVSPRFLSWSIDISVLAGGFWWEGSQGVRRGLGTLRVAPLNLNNEKLDKLVHALGPAWLRVGGSEADKIHYFSSPDTSSDNLVLSKSMWDSLHAFIQRHDLHFMFTAKYGLFKRSESGGWAGGELEELLRYSAQKGFRIDACELGNELNAYWAFHGLASQPRAKHLAADYARFIQVIKQFNPDCKIIGPGSAFWPRLGETIKPFTNLSRGFLQRCKLQNTPIDAVNWHYYPFQSDRSPLRTRAAKLNRLLNPRALNDFEKYARQMRQLRDEFFPGAEMWTGETGSAQCGGQAKLSDRFASCFWWADQLGKGALLGQTVMIRQSLIGGDYGLIDRLRLKPRPDYWLSWLWKNLMGTEVYAVNNSHHLLRCYCHSTPNGRGKTLLLINLSGKALKIQAGDFGLIEKQYRLSAKKLNSKKVCINGIKARFNKGDFSLAHFDSEEIRSEVEGYSINFWLFR